MIIPAAWPKSYSPEGPHPRSGLPMFGLVAWEPSLSSRASRSERIVVARSGQPTTEGFRFLADQGFKTIVSLREVKEEDRDAAICHEAVICHDLGMRFIRMEWPDEKAPPNDLPERWLTVASDPENWPLIAHCKAGRGRTSVASAIIRHALDGWDLGAIMDEVRLYRLWLRGLVHVPLAKPQRRWLEEHCR